MLSAHGAGNRTSALVVSATTLRELTCRMPAAPSRLATAASSSVPDRRRKSFANTSVRHRCSCQRLSLRFDASDSRRRARPAESQRNYQPPCCCSQLLRLMYGDQCHWRRAPCGRHPVALATTIISFFASYGRRSKPPYIASSANPVRARRCSSSKRQNLLCIPAGNPQRSGPRRRLRRAHRSLKSTRFRSSSDKTPLGGHEGCYEPASRLFRQPQ